MIANNEVEIFVGSDNVARINVDGICALRVRLNPGCQIVLHHSDSEAGAIICIPSDKE